MVEEINWPENICPVCGEKPVIWAKCMRVNSRCENGHKWHTCTVHRKLVIGESDPLIDMSLCTCEEAL